MILYLLTAINLIGFYFDLVVVKAFSDVAGWLFCSSLAIFVVFSSKRDFTNAQTRDVSLMINHTIYSLGFIITGNEILGSLLILFTVILLIRINMHNN